MNYYNNNNATNNFVSSMLESLAIAIFVIAFVAGVMYAHTNFKVHITPREVYPQPKPDGTVDDQLSNDLNNSQSVDGFEPVPVDCVVSPDKWTEWSYCTKTCGDGGTQTRERIIIQLPLHGGMSCPHKANMTETRACNAHPC